jgi:hypothetical protein
VSTAVDPRDAEALATLPNGNIGQAFWPPERLSALRMCVELIITFAQVNGLSREAEGMALINLATAGSIPQGLILKVWQQQRGQS